MPTPCYLLTATDYAARWLRRYAHGPPTTPPCPAGYTHDARAPLPRRVKVRPWREQGTYSIPKMHPEPSHRDSRWPTHCACGYRFRARDAWQVFGQRLYQRSDTGELTDLIACPPGAIWRADWLEDMLPGPDGRTYVCKTPGGDWVIDGPASNCTQKDDWRLPAGDPGRHWCWNRHGVAPMLTVDKNGKTCAAGGGSILSGSYHGFLQAGVLT